MEWQQLSVRKCIPRILTTTTSNQCNKCGIQFKKVALATVKKSNAIEFISDVQHNTDTRSEIRYQKPVLQAWEENIWHFSTFIVITYSCSTVTSEYPETFFLLHDNPLLLLQCTIKFHHSCVICMEKIMDTWNMDRLSKLSENDDLWKENWKSKNVW